MLAIPTNQILNLEPGPNEAVKAFMRARNFQCAAAAPSPRSPRLPACLQGAHAALPVQCPAPPAAPAAMQPSTFFPPARGVVMDKVLVNGRGASPVVDFLKVASGDPAPIPWP